MQDSNSTSNEKNSFFDRLASHYRDVGWKPLTDWDKPLFFPHGRRTKSLFKVLEGANKTLEKSTKFINKIKSRELVSMTRAKSIPANATIRKEYINCGKVVCQHKHGPYYYAYWKDPESKKLKKKYIGDHMPRKKELGNGYGIENYTL